MKALGIIGYHHTGKTTLATALISALKAKGYSVSSVKDIHHQMYRADTEGSNTAKHSAAGAQAVFAKGLYDSALLFPSSLALTEVIPHFHSQWLIIEGLKTAPVPKIVCAQNTDELDELIDDTTIGISGIIASELSSYRGLPVFCLEKHLPHLVELIQEKCFSVLPDVPSHCCGECGFSCYDLACRIVQGKAQRSDCVLDAKQKLRLMVNDQEVIIVPFIQRLLADIIRSYVANLKDVDSSGRISIEID